MEEDIKILEELDEKLNILARRNIGTATEIQVLKQPIILFVQSILKEKQKYKEKYKQLEEKNKHLSSVSDYETICMECNHLEEQLEIANDRVKQLEEEKARYEYKYEIAFNKLIEYEKTLEKLQKETIWKSKVKEKIEEIDKKIKCLHEELTKCCEERDKLGTETEIDNNEVRIFTLEEEIDKLHTQKQILEDLLREE